VGSEVLVLLQRLALNFQSQGPSELLAIDPETDSIAWQLVLEGLKGCGRAELSPSGELLALSCTGAIDFDGNLEDPGATGIVLLDATARPPREIRRIALSDVLGFSPQAGIAFASDDVLIGKTQTPLGGAGNNQLFALDLTNDEARVLAEASADDQGRGEGIVFAGLVCTPGCSDVCMVADRQRLTLRRFSISADLEELEGVSAGRALGLPPLDLAPF
jgi:hypothetical protein